MYNNTTHIRIAFIVIVIIWIALQTIFVVYYGDVSLVNGGDDLAYRKLAVESFEKNTWYPNSLHYTDNFIFAPGYVNLLILILHVAGCLQPILYLNIIFNITILALIFSLCYTFFCIRVSYFSAMLYMLLNSNLLAPTISFTELPFILLTLLAMFFLLKDTWNGYLLFGIILAIANWIRPLAIAWLVSGIVYVIWIKRNRVKSFFLPVSILLIGYLLFSLIIGCSTKLHFPDFNYKSTTGGWNLIMGANDNCNGTYNDDVFHVEGEIGYLNNDTLSYKERDKFYKQQAMNWILNNPIKYFSFLPLKIKYLFLYDNQYDMSGDVINRQPYWVFILSKLSFSNKIVNLVHNMIYWLILFLSFISLRFIKDKKICMLQLIIILTTITTLITVGHPRYHQVFMPEMIICAGFIIYNFFIRQNIH